MCGRSLSIQWLMALSRRVMSLAHEALVKTLNRCMRHTPTLAAGSQPPLGSHERRGAHVAPPASAIIPHLGNRAECHCHAWSATPRWPAGQPAPRWLAQPEGRRRGLGARGKDKDKDKD